VKIKIAVISDIHAAEEPVENQRGDIAETLLLKVIHRLKRWIKPDVVLVLGDIISEPSSPGTREAMARIKQSLELLECPSIIIPGNHDCDRDLFYEFFPKPPDFVDIKGFRFVPFIDTDLPEYLAHRSSEDIERMKAVRCDYAGPVIALQHTSLFPVGASECPYNFTNASEIIAAMKGQGIFLSLSGHYHKGLVTGDDGARFIAVTALCEDPFGFSEIDIDGSEVAVSRHQLKMPEHLGLIDCHSHTHLAYCSDNMDVAKSINLAEALGLETVLFTEHTGQLYFSAEDFWKGTCYETGLAGISQEHNRMDQYFEILSAQNVERRCTGLEVDCDYDGNLIVKKSDAERAQFLMGSIHRLKELAKENPDRDRVYEEFLGRVQVMLDSGIKVLAHPFRLFHRGKVEVEESLCKSLVKMLRESSVAAELNFHTQQPSEAFVQTCLEAGVKLTLASDAHSLYEVGELAPHLKLLADCGYNGDLKDILFDPRQSD